MLYNINPRLSLYITAILLLIGFIDATYAQNNPKLPKQVQQIQKKAKMPSVKQVPDPLNSSLYDDPFTTFKRAQYAYLNNSYLQTLREAKPTKDSLMYTRTMHAAAVQEALDFDKSYSFDLTQYVRFTDWNGRFTFITMHYNIGTGTSALEFLDSTMMRHTIIVNPNKKQTILMSIDKTHQVSITLLPILIEKSTVPALISSDAYDKNTRTEPVEAPAVVGIKGMKVNVEEGLFNKASITYSEDYIKSKYTLSEVLRPWLPVQTMHVVGNMSLKSPILLDLSASYGDKQYYSSSWKTVKLTKKPHQITLANTKIN